MTRRMITIERTFNAAIEDVWALWTTADGIESWWGPEGFRVKVRKLELRAGGALHYDMIAAGPDQIGAGSTIRAGPTARRAVRQRVAIRRCLRAHNRVRWKRSCRDLQCTG